MRILITGHRGFIGSHALRAFRGKGHEVVGYDRKEGHDLSLGVWIDLLVGTAPNVIVHLASSCSTPGSVRDPLGTFRDTVVTATTVCEVARETGAVLLLTSSVKARDGKTPYGAAKHMAETWAIEMGKAFSFPVIVDRPGTIYGPGQEGSEESGWIAWFLKAQKDGLEVIIDGDGGQMRDLLHVGDYVELLLLQAEDPRPYLGHIWDVGGGEDNVVTVREMADFLRLDYTFGPPRYGDARAYVGVNDVPGWRPTILWLESGMFG